MIPDPRRHVGVLLLVVAWAATAPYWFQPVAPGTGVGEMVIASFEFIWGVWPWLVRHPLRGALVVPFILYWFFIVPTRRARPVRA